MSDTFNDLSDEHLKAIADGKFDSLPDEVLHQIAGGPSAAPAQTAKPNPYAGASRAELLAAQQGILDNDPETLKAKAGMFGRALGSATLKVGLPATAVALAPATGGASLAALGAATGILGEYLGNKVAGEDTTPGGLASAGIVNAVPGGSLVNAGLGQVVKQGAKYALTNVAAKEAQSLLDTGAPASAGDLGTAAAFGFGGAPLSRFIGGVSNRASTVSNRMGEGSPMRDVLKDAKSLGMVVPPVVTNPSLGNKVVHALGGGADVVNAAKEVNGPAVVQAVRQELGFKPGQAMNEASLNAKAVGTNLVYDKIANVSPEAAFIMSQFKDFTAKARRAFNAYNGSMVKQPESLEAAKTLQAEADAAAELMREELKNNKASHLWDEFQNSRKLRAQIELTKEAISPGGRINADVFGNALEAGRPLSGNFEKIARVQSEFSKYVSQFQPTPSGGSSIIRQALGVIPRKAALSGFGQGFANPNYGMATESLGSQVGRLGLMSGGRELVPSLPKKPSRN